MKRVFQLLAVLVGIWLLGSFLGVMFNPGRADLWTRSLMWAMLSSVILAPVFIFFGTSGSDTNSGPHNSPGAHQSFDAEDRVEVSQEEGTSEEESWPYNT